MEDYQKFIEGKLAIIVGIHFYIVLNNNIYHFSQKGDTYRDQTSDPKTLFLVSDSRIEIFDINERFKIIREKAKGKLFYCGDYLHLYVIKEGRVYRHYPRKNFIPHKILFDEIVESFSIFETKEKFLKRFTSFEMWSKDYF